MLMSGGGGVKHVYRGITSGAGNVTLPAAVNMDKTVVLSTSKGSAGYVAARGSISFPEFTIYGKPENTNTAIAFYSSYGGLFPSGGNNSNRKFFIQADDAGSISGGSTSLTVKEYSARLVDENTIYCDGPVEWQVIEYN